MLFLSIQQELDCITDSGEIIGKIKFDDQQGKHIFYSHREKADAQNISRSDESAIAERLRGLDSGQYQIPMQDDD